MRRDRDRCLGNDRPLVGVSVTDDVASNGDDRPRERRDRRAVIVIILAALVVGSAFVADRYFRTQETSAILDRVEAGQRAVVFAQLRVSANVQYTSPLLLSTRVSDDVRLGLEAIVRESARERAQSLRAQLAASRSVPVLAWHAAQREARDVYARLLEATIGYFESVSQDIGGLFERDPALETAERAARRALIAAATDQRARARARALLTVP